MVTCNSSSQGAQAGRPEAQGELVLLGESERSLGNRRPCLKKKVARSQKNGPGAERPALEGQGLNLDPQNPCKRPGAAASIRNPQQERGREAGSWPLPGSQAGLTSELWVQ